MLIPTKLEVEGIWNSEVNFYISHQYSKKKKNQTSHIY